MAIWLWVTGLDPKNDWMELSSFSFGASGRGGSFGQVSHHDAQFTLNPGRFRMRLYNWLLRGEAKTAYVFFDPQTEFEFRGSMVTGLSTSGASDVTSMSINFEKMTVTHSGAP